MNELVKQFLPDLTWAIFWAFLIGLILLILAGVLLIKNIRTYSREKAARGHGNVPGEKKSLKDYATKTKGFFTRFKDMSLNLRKKYVGDMRDETAQSFQRAIEVLQGYFGPKDAQYHLPWYMVIGCDGSGKSTFLDGAQLELPIGDPVNEITSDLSPVSWKFFDQAVVADVRGDLLLGEKGVNSDEGQWSYILNLFKFYRPKRPIDGIILTIPADEVAGENRFSKDDISARGRAIYAKLWKLQNTLGMRVPVYIVITKSDKIPGFSSLVAQLPENKRQEMLGWSSPYDIHMAFTEEWIETIFRGLRKGFNRLRASIFTRDLIDERRIGNALLPIELASMKETLGLYILTMFKESSYHDSFFLRGVYFTGLGDNQDVINFLQQQQASGSSEQNSNPELGKLVFVSDILSQKVFQEYPICEPNTRLLVSTNKALNTAKVAGSVLAFIWCVGLLNSYQRLKITNQNLFPSLSLINDSIVGANERMSGGNRSKLEKYLNVQSEKVMAEFVEIEAVDSYSIFIPASWFSLVDEKIERSFTSAYDKVILPSISGALKMRIANIVARDSGVQPAAQSKDPFPNPISSPSFERLERFTQEISDLESHISSFNRLKSSTSVHDLGRLTKYLFNRSLPQQFFSNSDYYRQALGDIFGEKIV
ncbi:MAG: type VI secretion system protein, partial [Alphaproteobacteria bacterium]|nr:type VI secretion system protein [Alphaproteobacteria bacterium]